MSLSCQHHNWDYTKDVCTGCGKKYFEILDSYSKAEREALDAQAEKVEIKVKGFYELRDKNSSITPECTCVSLLNGHMLGCPMEKK